MAYGLQTYQDSIRREDLLDIISDVSPDENPLTTMLGTSDASQTLHEWPEDYIARPSSVVGTIEGAEASFSDLTQPSRRNNITQIIRQTFKVSGTESDVDVAGMADPFDYQAEKALREWKNQLEFSLVNGVMASGSSGVARQMAGLQAVITTHSTARSSGTSLSEAEFNEMVREVWTDVGSEDVFDLVLVPMGLKQKISTFTAGSTRYIDASEKRLVKPVMVYESDGGIHRIFAHKDVRAAAGTVTFLGIKEDKYRVSYLRRPTRKELPANGDYRAGMIIGEATLEYMAERTSVQRTGYNIQG